jgi:tetraacyldisaccharide 4'-kinase
MRVDRFLYQKEKPLWERALLFPLYLLSLPYGAAVRLRSRFYSIGLWKTKRLPCPVISVGNITVGGTGKTPLVMALAKGLMERGIPVGVLSRGYKGKKTLGRPVSDGKTISLSPEESGDEPFLIAASLKGIPVLVGKDRFVTGQMALQRFRVSGLLLDDGYQHLQLHRDLNILLIDSRVGFGDFHLLPRGILREPLAHLRRSHLFLLTKVERLEDCKDLEARIRRIHPSAPMFHSNYKAVGLIGPNGEWEEIESLKGKKVLSLSGIADPGHFSYLLERSGMRVAEEVVFPDHHAYGAGDLTSLLKKVNPLEWIVTTEKDMVKLRKLKIEGLPIRALRIEVSLWEEEAFFKKVMEFF